MIMKHLMGRRLRYLYVAFLTAQLSFSFAATEDSPPDADIPGAPHSETASPEDTSKQLPDMGPMKPSDQPLAEPEVSSEPVRGVEKTGEPGAKEEIKDAPHDDVSENSDTDAPSHRFAAGFNLAWTSRQDYGSRTFRRLTPEIVGFSYGSLPLDHYWWRAGLRLGYSTAQPEMPQAVRIEETDTTTLAEIAVTKDWYIVPSFAFGGGYDSRKTKVKVSAPIDTVDDRINRKETLWMWYVQAGAGLPLLKGLILLEPTIRYHTIQYDNRSHWMFGIETTIGI